MQNSKQSVDRFDDALKFIGVALLILSFIETKNLLQYMIGYSTFEEVAYVWIGSILVNAVETVCFIFWYKNRSNRFYTSCFAFLLGVSFGLISVVGSLGWFQTKQEINTLSSNEYRQLQSSIQHYEKQSESWRESAKNKDLTGWANTKAEKAQDKADQLRVQLSQISANGAGVGNAIYKLFGKLGSVDTYTASAISGMVFSSMKEIAAIFLLILGMFGASAKTCPKPKKKSAQNFGSDNDNSAQNSALRRKSSASISEKLRRKISAACENPPPELLRGGRLNVSAVARKFGVDESTVRRALGRKVS